MARCDELHHFDGHNLMLCVVAVVEKSGLDGEGRWYGVGFNFVYFFVLYYCFHQIEPSSAASKRFASAWPAAV